MSVFQNLNNYGCSGSVYAGRGWFLVGGTVVSVVWSILQTHEVDPPKKEKWLTKKRIKLRRRGKPQTRGTHPRHLNVKLDKAKIKEALLIERLELYEAPKLQALEKTKYEQSLESVRRFIAVVEKELELYYRHLALYGDPNNRIPSQSWKVQRKSPKNHGNSICRKCFQWLFSWCLRDRK
ncbi:hypothetical protein EZV62_001384 [Acer yangbiense]|uniref:Uncharacterized protein n=1 Tax=Acer yangbiense TaxID=1000413 RepID=A0A5C7IUC6_9ROSI|nr:hypothetical protein EZV62_001384 [Acer yangbiense]